MTLVSNDLTSVLKPTTYRLGKNKLHKLHGVNFFKRFSAKFVNFFAKFGCLNLHIRNNLNNVIFIACKWSKICKYFVNSIVISCSTCQTKENNAHGLNIWFTLYFCNFKHVVIYAFFPPNPYSQNFRVRKKSFFPKSDHRQHDVGCCGVGRWTGYWALPPGQALYRAIGDRADESFNSAVVQDNSVCKHES